MLDYKKVFIFGYSGHSYVILESLLARGYSILGYFDYKKAVSNPYQIPYLGFERDVDVKSIVNDGFVFPSIGENSIREKLITFFDHYQLNQFVLIDPSANVSSTAKINVSTYVGKHACINAQSQIGKGVIINTSAVIEHECDIKDYIHIAPGTIICGNVTIGESTFIGANSVIRNNTSICSNVLIGAGSVVVKSIEEKGIWFGSPVKKEK